MRAILILYFAFITCIINAQELKRITKSNNEFGEIYYVLKNDRSVKHGEYLRYFESMNIYDKAIDAYGNYDKNKKTGTWFFCDAENPMNPLISIGEFENNDKVGQWEFFYTPFTGNQNFISLIGNTKMTKVILPTKDKEEFGISIDTIGTKIAARGKYSNNKKTGVWDYYSRTGLLVCKYDFSSNKIIYNGLSNYEILGSIERFKALFHQSAIEKRETNRPFFTENSSVVLEISTDSDSLSINRLNYLGSLSFANTMEDIIKKMSLDWINFDPRLEQKQN